MNIKVIKINLIGEIVIRKSYRAKRISITIKPNNGVTVVVPQYVSFAEGERFARSKKEWILKHLPKIRQVEKLQTVFDENTKFRTAHHKLVIKKSDTENMRILINSPTLKFEYPKEYNIRDPFVQEAIRLSIAEVLRIEAKLFLPERVNNFAEKFGFKFNNLAFKNAKTRWGSCSSRNNINLNIHLMRLPERLINYVILHELTHTIHKNHSKKFWDTLEKVLPNSKKYDKELQNYSPKIF